MKTLKEIYNGLQEYRGGHEPAHHLEMMEDLKRHAYPLKTYEVQVNVMVEHLQTFEIEAKSEAEALRMAGHKAHAKTLKEKGTAGTIEDHADAYIEGSGSSWWIEVGEA